MVFGTRTRPQREKLIEAARWREIDRRGGRWWTGFHHKIRFIAIKEGIEFDGKQDLRDHFSDTVTAFFRLGTWIGVGEPDFIFQIVKPPLITLARSFDCLPCVMKRT